MLQALLHGKLSREQENMEDMLTSIIFGFMQYLSETTILSGFLSKAYYINEDRDIKQFRQLSSQNIKQVSFDYWPTWNESGCFPCEPDLVLRIDTPNGDALIILIEAKYHSGKSSEAIEGDNVDLSPYDQLAREWDNLISIAKHESRTPYLIYLTNDIGYPSDDLSASSEDYRRSRSSKETEAFRCFWLSWRHLKDSIKQTDSLIYVDLIKLLRKLNLIFYDGIAPISVVRPRDWRYVQFFNWTASTKHFVLDWRFTP